MTDDQRALPFLRINDRDRKPRRTGITEIRGPYYSAIGAHQVEDVLTVAGPYVDWFKIPAPSLALVPLPALRQLVALCHAHEVEVSAGGLVELMLARGPDHVSQFFDALAEYEFDIVEVSAGMLAISDTDFLRVVERAKKTGLTVKAEVGIQFGAGGTSSIEVLANAGTGSVSGALRRARDALEAGADMIVLESEGVTESVEVWRTDVPSAFRDGIGLEKVMFEAADPPVFEWYVKNFGPDVNLFVDYSQILHLESLRSGVWGPSELFGRVVTYRG